MNRLAVGTLVGAILSSVGGCGPADDSSYSYSGYAGNYGVPDCSQYTSCATCTPLVGCGWCAYPDGTGTCASGPDNCTTEWIWEPNFCSPASDAGGAPDALPPDAGFTDATPSAQLDAALDSPPETSVSDAAEESTSDAAWVADQASEASGDSEPDAALDASLDASLDQSTAASLPIIADGGGCTPNDGSLCGSGQPYGVTCVQSGTSTDVPEPPPSLECTVASAPTPDGTLYYCCLNAPSGVASSAGTLIR